MSCDIHSLVDLLRIVSGACHFFQLSSLITKCKHMRKLVLSYLMFEILGLRKLDGFVKQ